MKTVEEIIERLKEEADDIDDIDEIFYGLTVIGILDEIIEWIENSEEES